MRQLGGDQVRSARQAGGDDRLRPGATALELGGQPVGPRRPARRRSARRRPSARPAPPGCGAPSPPRPRAPGARRRAAGAPWLQRRSLSASSGGQQLQLADGARRVADHAGQQALELAGHARDRLPARTGRCCTRARPAAGPSRGRRRPASGRTWRCRSRLRAGRRSVPPASAGRRRRSGTRT